MGGERHCGGQSAGHRVISARSTDFRVSLTILRTLVSAFRSIDGKLRQSEQACQYRPRQRKYPGDEMCRDATTENRKRRKSPSASGGDQYIVQAGHSCSKEQRWCWSPLITCVLVGPPSCDNMLLERAAGRRCNNMRIIDNILLLQRCACGSLMTFVL